MNLRRGLAQNVILISIVSCLFIYYVYQYFRIENLMEDIELEYENALYSDMEVRDHLEPKPLVSPEDKHLLFQSNIEKEFPTVWYGKPKIPHIIHVVWQNATIPFTFVKIVRSYYMNNPNWEFRFWTFKMGRKLIEDTHPYLLKYFDLFNDTIDGKAKKAGMIRNVVMYEYGGFTAEMDVASRRPLDVATMKYGCILPAEPFEHSVFQFNFDFILSAKVLFCRPKHPFFGLLLNHMKHIKKENDAFEAVGAGKLTNVFFSYNNLTMTDIQKRKTDDKSNSPYCYRGERSEDDEDAVYVPNTQYFNDEIHRAFIDKEGNLKPCKSTALQAYIVKRACAEFLSRKELREKQKYEFTTRMFYRIWDRHYTSRVVHIKKIAPKIIFYK